MPTDSLLCVHSTEKEYLQGLLVVPQPLPQTAGSLNCSGLRAFSPITVIFSNCWPENLLCSVILLVDAVVGLCISVFVALGHLN